MPRRLPPDIQRELAALEAFIAKHEAAQAERRELEQETLGGFIERISPHFSDPRHLAEFVDVLEQAQRAARGLGPPVFACLSVPPQHAKTETFKHWFARLLRLYPEIFGAYLSYNSDRAVDQSRSIRDYARIAGVELRQDTQGVELWRTPEGGGLAARGILGAITGLAGLTIIVVDDPFKNRQEAESLLIRDRVWGEFVSSIWTRLRKRTSIIVIHTRWHEDDLIGRIKAHAELSQHFRFINLPAINDRGEALWPEEMPLELLAKKRAVSERAWWALYMGQPRPNEGRVFPGVSFYDERPAAMRIGIGIDFAYTAKTSSDWNVAIVGGVWAGQFYIVDAVRRQCTAPQWQSVLRGLSERYPHAPMRAYIGGTERGSTDYLLQAGLPLEVIPATRDKLVRARPVADAWEMGRVHMPREETTREGSDLAAVLDTIHEFTGIGDACDDDVDALAAAYDLLVGSDAPLVDLPSPDAPRTERNPWADRGRASSRMW